MDAGEGLAVPAPPSDRVPGTPLATAPDPPGAGTVDGGSTAPADAVGPGSVTQGGSPAAAQHPTTGAAPAGSAGGAQGRQTDAPAQSDPGVSDDSIKIGFVHATDSAAAHEAFGTNLASGNQRAQQQAFVDAVNRRGGIAGRRVVPVFAGASATSTNPEGESEAICTRFTQDEPVFAVISTGGSDNFRHCVTASGAVLVVTYFSTASSSSFARFPGYVEPDGLSLNRIGATKIPALARQGYFSAWDSATGGPAAAGTAKVGVITLDSPNFAEAVDNALLPALQRAGYAVDPSHVQRIPPTWTLSDTGAASAAVSSAVLRFRTDGVSHVVFLQTGAVASLLFLQEAQTQSYFPRYGFDSHDAPQALMEGAGLSPQQMRGALGIGWVPSIDLSGGAPAFDDRPPTKRCLQVLRDAGLTPTNANDKSMALGFCDGLDLLRRVGAVTATDFSARLPLLGKVPVALGLEARFDLGNRDGISTVHDYRFSEQCTCFAYAGRPRPAA